MGLGPAATAPVSPPRGYAGTVEDHSNSIALFSRGTPVCSSQVSFMNIWMYWEERTVMRNHDLEMKDTEKARACSLTYLFTLCSHLQTFGWKWPPVLRCIFNRGLRVQNYSCWKVVLGLYLYAATLDNLKMYFMGPTFNLRAKVNFKGCRLENFRFASSWNEAFE